MRNRLQSCQVATMLTLPAFVLADPPDGYLFLSFDRVKTQSKTEGKPLLAFFGRYGRGC